MMSKIPKFQIGCGSCAEASESESLNTFVKKIQKVHTYSEEFHMFSCFWVCIPEGLVHGIFKHPLLGKMLSEHTRYGGENQEIKLT